MFVVSLCFPITKGHKIIRHSFQLNPKDTIKHDSPDKKKPLMPKRVTITILGVTTGRPYLCFPHFSYPIVTVL